MTRKNRDLLWLAGLLGWVAVYVLVATRDLLKWAGW